MDHLKIPFNITNQIEHPDRPNYLIFHFREDFKANQFEAALKEENVFYERGEQEEDDGSIRYLFGVRKSDTEVVEKLNYIVIGHYRDPFIKDKAARWFIIGFGILLGIFALLGAILSK